MLSARPERETPERGGEGVRRGAVRVSGVRRAGRGRWKGACGRPGARGERPSGLPGQLRAGDLRDPAVPGVRGAGDVLRRGRRGRGPGRRPGRRLLRDAERVLQPRPARAAPAHPLLPGGERRGVRQDDQGMDARRPRLPGGEGAEGHLLRSEARRLPGVQRADQGAV